MQDADQDADQDAEKTTPKGRTEGDVPADRPDVSAETSEDAPEDSVPELQVEPAADVTMHAETEEEPESVPSAVEGAVPDAHDPGAEPAVLIAVPPGAQKPGRGPSRRARRKAKIDAMLPPDRHRYLRRRRRWHFSIWSVLFIVLAVLFLGLFSMSATGRVVALPEALVRQVETAINKQAAPVSISLSRVELGVSPKGRARVRLVDLGVRDSTGLELGRINALEGALLMGPVFAGRAEPASLALSGAQITVRRNADGAFDLSFGQGVGASGDLATMLDRVDELFAKGVLAQTEGISADALTITLEDARSGRLWQVTDGRLDVSQSEDAVDMTLAFDVFNQTETLAETVLGFRSVKGSSEAQLTATFKNALSRDIAAQSPLLTFLGVLDAPISGALRTAIDETGAIADLAGTLEFGAGTLSPDPGVQPVSFTGGKVYLDYDPERERMQFAQMSLESEWGEAQASGHAYLRGWSGGWPSELIGQLELAGARFSPPDVLEAPVELGAGAADFRLSLDPFQIELGQFTMTHDGRQLRGSGSVKAGSQGWNLAVNMQAERVDPDHVTALWPVNRGKRTRTWVRDNITKGHFNNVNVAWRKRPDAQASTYLSAGFTGVTVRAVKGMVPIENASGRFTIDDRRLVVSADQGILRPLAGNGKVAGVLNAGGTSFIVPQMARPPKDPEVAPVPVPAEVRLSLDGPVRAMLHLLDGAPFRVFKDKAQGENGIGPDMASGQARVGGKINLMMQPKIPPDAISYDLTGRLSGVESSRIVAGHKLELPRADLKMTDEMLQISAQGSLSGVPVSGRWEQAMSKGKAAPQSTVSGALTLNAAFLDAFKIGLPKGSVSGAAKGRYKITLEKGKAPRLSLEAGLKGLGLSIAPLGWSKAKGSDGQVSLTGTLGTTPYIDQIALSAPGLSAAGSIRVADGGGLDAAKFDRVKLGGWFDAPVTLTGRGAGNPVAVNVTGGRVDMRRATLGSGKGSGGAGGDMPISIILDQLTISEGITLTRFEGDFTSGRAGLSGTFRGRVGGGPEIRGSAAPQPKGTAFRISATDAGAVLKAAGLFKNAREGKLELILAPGGGKGVYEGNLKIEDNIDIHNAPALAELLSAISVIGLLQQLGGKGISFTDVDARFRLDPEKVTIYESAASGHSMGISMDGYYFLGSGQMKMQGVISPFYAVNSAGRIFARRGEGLVGFNYGLSGTPAAPQVSVNPLSLFTPGFFRDIFRRDPPPRPE